MNKFNEDSRVKIPTILHLIRLGYEYLSLKDTEWNIDYDYNKATYILDYIDN